MDKIQKQNKRIHERIIQPNKFLYVILVLSSALVRSKLTTIRPVFLSSTSVSSCAIFILHINGFEVK